MNFKKCAVVSIAAMAMLCSGFAEICQPEGGSFTRSAEMSAISESGI